MNFDEEIADFAYRALRNAMSIHIRDRHDQGAYFDDCSHAICIACRDFSLAIQKAARAEAALKLAAL